MKTPINITSTQEDYLRAIYYLGQNQPVKPVVISRYLNLTKQTVTERLQRLAKINLVKHEPYSTVSLTHEGKKIAQHLTYKHRLIEVFLYKLLKRPKNTIHEEAHRLEHAFSDDSIRQLYKLLHKPKVDPHGKPI